MGGVGRVATIVSWRAEIQQDSAGRAADNGVGFVDSIPVQVPVLELGAGVGVVSAAEGQEALSNQPAVNLTEVSNADRPGRLTWFRHTSTWCQKKGLRDGVKIGVGICGA